jgi:hypothetical protein
MHPLPPPARRLLLVFFAAALPVLAPLAFAARSEAQQAGPMARGAFVRLMQADSVVATGRLVGIGPDSVRLSDGAGANRVAFALASLDRLEVREREARGRSALRWGGRAFLVGASIGAGYCLIQPDDCRSEDLTWTEATLGTALFLGTGASMYGLIGGALFPGSRWRAVPLPVAGPVGAGAAIGVSVTR